MDFLNNRAERENITVGMTYILPSSFIGSPRFIQQAYQDSMAICAKFGKPTFFLTFTCNPKWPEITGSKSKHVVDQESSTPYYIYCPVKKVSKCSCGVRTKESFRVRAQCLFIITRTIWDAKLNPFIKEKKE
jgi:hypothetical protein